MSALRNITLSLLLPLVLVTPIAQAAEQDNSDASGVLQRISSFTDMILVKIARIKQIEDNQGKTTVSEGSDANYQDIINYAIFALIRL